MTTATAPSRPRNGSRTSFREFLELESAGGVFLLGATLLGLILANSPVGHALHDFWHAHVEVRVGIVSLDESLVHWVNDGLMTIFFLVAGLEIKRELVVGELRDPRRASLPAIAALGGMAAPALLYVVVNLGGDGAHGWGIPVATDIAFAVTVLAVVGRHLPGGLKVFLLSLAIADDIGAVLIIAFFYSSSLDPTWLAITGGLFAAVIILKRMDVWFVPVYVVVGTAIWFAMFESGVHATLAGVILGLMAPAVARRPDPTRVEVDHSTPFGVLHEVLVDARETVPVTDRLLHILHPWTAFVILPLFALANSGVELSTDALGDAATSPVTLGVVAGLVLGKATGIYLATRLAVVAGVGSLPEGVTWRAVLGVAFLGGIGFTVSLFITGLAFADPHMQDAAKIGILVASAVAATVGAIILRGETARYVAAHGVPEPAADARH